MIHGIFHIKKVCYISYPSFTTDFPVFFTKLPPTAVPTPLFAIPQPVPSTWGLPRANNWCLGCVQPPSGSAVWGVGWGFPYEQRNNLGLGKEHSNCNIISPRVWYTTFQIVWLHCFFLSETSCSMRKCNVSACFWRLFLKHPHRPNGRNTSSDFSITSLVPTGWNSNVIFGGNEGISQVLLLPKKF